MRDPTAMATAGRGGEPLSELLRCALPSCHHTVSLTHATDRRWLLVGGRWFCTHDHADRYAAGDH